MKKLLLLSVFLYSQFAFTQTYHSGTVTGTWAVSGNPHIITGDVSVAGGTSLTIEPGALVKFDGHYKLSVAGNLYAQGTKNNVITFTRNTGNIGSMGAGIRFLSSSVDTSIISYCIVEYGAAYDSATPTNSNNFGGGIYCSNSNLIIENSMIRGNKAHAVGGGIYADMSSRILIIRNNTIFSNEVNNSNINSNGGGGMYINCYNSGFARIENNLIISNINHSANPSNFEGGGGVTLMGTGNTCFLLNNTIVGNSSLKGSGVMTKNNYAGSIVNNIIWGNLGSTNNDQIAIETLSNPDSVIPAGLNISNNCIQDTAIVVVVRNSTIGKYYKNGINNIKQNPLFVMPGNYNYRLQSTSPCIDAGSNSYSMEPVDLEGNPRIFDGDYDGNTFVDIGAFEYDSTLISCIINHNQAITRLYPNPATEYFTLEMLVKQADDFEISITNIAGQKMYNEQVTQYRGVLQKRFNCRDYPKGIYFLQIKSDSQILNKKVIIE